jgi:NAD(P)-dependent dehydrogenase (short-subunit alcohol dehydrogenase family)
MDSLSGRAAVVTGGTSGIGRACAVMLAELGARVTVGDLDELPENREQFDRLGIRFVGCDVRSESDVRQLIEQGCDEQGRLHALVNNAGIGLIKPITEVDEADWDRVLDTNLKGAFFGCKHAIKRMKPHGGSIVNVSSNAGLLPRAHDPVYSISKGALVALTKSLALCHSVDRIRVNAVCPGPVGDTRMMNDDLNSRDDPESARASYIAASPLAQSNGRMIRPDEIASAVAYLVRDESVFITGTMIAIDGGKSLGVPPKSS